jgi:hypothetical protein
VHCTVLLGCSTASFHLFTPAAAGARSVRGFSPHISPQNTATGGSLASKPAAPAVTQGGTAHVDVVVLLVQGSSYALALCCTPRLLIHLVTCCRV